MVCSQSCLHVRFPSGATRPTSWPSIGSGCGVRTRPEGHVSHQCGRRKGGVQSQPPWALGPPHPCLTFSFRALGALLVEHSSHGDRMGGAECLGSQDRHTLSLTGVLSAAPGPQQEAPSASSSTPLARGTSQQQPTRLSRVNCHFSALGVGFPLARLLQDQRGKSQSLQVQPAWPRPGAAPCPVLGC